jgi:hypothetical protein
MTLSAPAAALAVLVLAAGLLYAEKQPTVQRLGDGDLIHIKTMVRFTTLIVLPEGEEISEVTCGDKDLWVVEGKEQNVHVKPAKEGARTNLNIVSKSRAVYSFLLEEISGPKGRPANAKPDLIVRVSPEEVSQLRKDKENLSEALSRAERELKAEKERAAEADRKRLQPKEETKALPKKAAEPPKVEAVPVLTKPVADSQPTAALVTSAVPAAPPRDETFAVYTIEKAGVLEKTGRAVGGVLRRVGRFLRLF